MTHDTKNVDQDPSKEDVDRLNSDSITASRTLKDLNILQEYIQNEGNLPDVKAKCKECIKKNCRTCFKLEKMSPKEVAVLEEMRSNIEERVMPDNTIKYSGIILGSY